MFEQFRSHFPQGSLISELVQIDHGKYIVRASVQNEGLTLATGLAAAETVEQAEDQARLRALAVLDISLTPLQRSSVSSFAPPENKEKETVPSAPTSLQDHAAIAAPHQEKTIAAQTVESDFTPSPPEAEETKVVQEEDAPPASQNGSESPAPTVSATSSSEEETTMDCSDIIARTNVELRRLRWTNEQGRKFLAERYGKRSRSLLSESELREFLEYLEQQPTPPQDNE